MIDFASYTTGIRYLTMSTGSNERGMIHTLKKADAKQFVAWLAKVRQCKWFRYRGWLYALSGMLTFLMLCVVCYVNHIAPFHDGTYSLAVQDADFQYLDFFAYYKDLLAGKASLGYDFSKGLGGGMIAVFAYYLCSPLNVLVVFFQKSQLAVFYDVLVIIKLCLAAIFMSIFLDLRFERKLSRLYILILSVSYAFMQYNMLQARNVMWLDGMYMLPLLMLGVYRVVRKQDGRLLAVMVFLTIVCNWYTAAIDGLFLCLWGIAEVGFYYQDFASKGTWLNIGKDILRFCVSGLIGIGCSSFLLVPAFLKMRGGRGTIDRSFLTNAFFGNPLNDARGLLYYHHQSYLGQSSLYAGVFVVIGFVAFFLSKTIVLREKLLIALVFGVLELSFHWQPLYFLFSLLKDASSYWYRYSYLAVAVAVFAMAMFCLHVGEGENRAVIFRSIAVSSLILFIVTLNSDSDTKNMMMFVLAMVIVGSLLSLTVVNSNRPAVRSVCAVVLVCACAGDLAYSAHADFRMETLQTAHFHSYVEQTQQQIEAIQYADGGYYRINQTSNREMAEGNLTANMNEGLAYNYNPISVYTSDPDEGQRNFLDKVGYRKNGDNFNVVNDSILGADSLLGVKYVLSQYPIEGLEQLDIPKADGKAVYRNPYALPLAFYGNDAPTEEMSAENEFEYQNALFSQLMGEKTELYVPVASARSQENGKTIYALSGYDASSPLYGVVHNVPAASTITMADGTVRKYSQWLAPGVVFIPHHGNTTTLTLSMDGGGEVPQQDGALFYALDLQELHRFSSRLTSKTPTINSFNDGYVRLTAEGEGSRNEVITTIPYDAEWIITVNGKQVQPHVVAGAFVGIPLEDGRNDITMQYHIRGAVPGAVITLLSIITACLLLVVRRRAHNRRNINWARTLVSTERNN
ncbi:YfhO family protein [Bifidobacterium sp. LC6]|uniref:YfhO family protein n=1 Tax=Bifidobacterium colobi TaxID=2809026 RepID=A0ABS5UX05_9BIFI|nr:YfhO family protein [Bifidobacterium colobi]MBT1175644.1 YfhO family protein [Bifidobacterium colobi]